jgi:hypothetical protein
LRDGGLDAIRFWPISVRCTLEPGQELGFNSSIVRFFDGADEPACALSTIAFLGPQVGYCRAIYMAIYPRSRARIKVGKTALHMALNATADDLDAAK